MRAVCAMRYWHPFTRERLRNCSCAMRRGVLLPLYPQYSSTTTGSSLNEWRDCFRMTFRTQRGTVLSASDVFRRGRGKVGEACRVLKSRRERKSFQRPQHSMSIVAKGDPYQRQIEETVRLLMGGPMANRHRLCYQSKVGASKWLQPSLHRTLRDLAGEKVREVCIVPVRLFRPRGDFG